MIKTLKRLAASIAIAVGLVAAGSGVAEAGAYTTQTTCATAVLGTRVCLDLSANTVTIYSDNTTVAHQEVLAGPLVAVGPIPTRGWIAYENECQNAWHGTGAGYNLNNANVSYFVGSGNHAWNNAPVSQAMLNHIIYATNSAGVECVVVP